MINMYERGQGAPQDYAQAAAWFRKAADQGFDLAQQSGLGVPQDYVKAALWYQKAADQGNAG
jgi:uncharacterized protein